MAISAINASGTAGGAALSGSGNATYPANVQADDVIILSLSARTAFGVPTVSTPSGSWQTIDTSGSGTSRLTVWYLIAAGTESGTLAVSTSGASFRWAMDLYRGVDTADVLAGTPVTGTSATLPSITTDADDAYRIDCVHRNATSGSVTPHANHTERWDGFSASGASGCANWGAYEPLGAAGSTGTRAITAASLTQTVSFALKPFVEPDEEFIEPAPVTITLAPVDPAVTVGSVAVTPAPVISTLAAVAPVVTASSAVTIAPDPVGASLSAVAPAVSVGATAIAPDAVGLTLSAVAPAVSVGTVSIAPDPVNLALASVAPSVAVGAVSVSPAPVGATLTVAAPVVFRSPAIRISLRAGEMGIVALGVDDVATVSLRTGESGSVSLRPGEAGSVALQSGETGSVSLRLGETGSISLRTGETAAISLRTGE